MKIHVTQRHIESGKPKDNHACPIALAVKSINTEFTRIPINSIRVGRHLIAINEEIYELPNIANQFITDFDKGEKVEPFTFAASPKTRRMDMYAC